MKKLLSRKEVDRELTDMWEKINGIPEEDEARDDQVQAALEKQKRMYQQLDLQDRILAKAWFLCHKVEPTDPLKALDDYEWVLNEMFPAGMPLAIEAEKFPETIGSL